MGNFFTAIFFFAFWGWVTIVLLDLISTPIVYLHPVTHQCVRVEATTPGKTCSNLPKRYTTVYALR